MLLCVITITIYYPFTSRDAPLSMHYKYPRVGSFHLAVGYDSCVKNHLDYDRDCELSHGDFIAWDRVFFVAHWMILATRRLLPG